MLQRRLLICSRITLGSGDLQRNSCQILCQGIVEFNGKTRPLKRLRLGLELPDLPVEEFASLAKCRPSQRTVPDENAEEKGQQGSNHAHETLGRPPRWTRQNVEILGTAWHDEESRVDWENRVPRDGFKNADANDLDLASRRKAVKQSRQWLRLDAEATFRRVEVKFTSSVLPKDGNDASTNTDQMPVIDSGGGEGAILFVWDDAE